MLLLKNLVFTVVVPGSVAVYIPIAMAGGWQALASAPWGWRASLALLPIAAGAAVYSRCVWDFGRVGRGTPAPIDAPKQLVVVGLYRHVRTPMYLGVLLVVTGWAVFFESRRILLFAGGVALAFHMFVVFYEEPHLARQFGASYERYSRAVRRWVPGRGYD